MQKMSHINGEPLAQPSSVQRMDNMRGEIALVCYRDLVRSARLRATFLGGSALSSTRSARRTLSAAATCHIVMTVGLRLPSSRLCSATLTIRSDPPFPGARRLPVAATTSAFLSPLNLSHRP